MQANILDVFVYGEENSALTDLFSTARIRELTRYRPIHFLGPTAVGKTSIAQTLAIRFARYHSIDQMIIVSGNDFARNLALAIEADDMERFRQKYRNAGVLVVDGLHELSNKNAAQEELSLTLEHRYDVSLLTILTSLVIPTDTRGLKPGLASRCIQGLSIELAFPGLESRRRIVDLLSRKLGLQLPSDEVENLITHEADTLSVIEIHGFLLRWLHQTRANQGSAKPVPTSSIKKLIEAQRAAKTPDISQIAKCVARENNLTIAELRGTSRKSQIVRARSLAMYLARQLTSLSFQQIGQYFGKRDHTTVMHACRKLEQDLTMDRELSQLATEIRHRMMI